MKKYVPAFAEMISLDETDVIVTSLPIGPAGDGDEVAFDQLFPNLV